MCDAAVRRRRRTRENITVGNWELNKKSQQKNGHKSESWHTQQEIVRAYSDRKCVCPCLSKIIKEKKTQVAAVRLPHKSANAQH